MNILNLDHISANQLLPEVQDAMVSAIKMLLRRSAGYQRISFIVLIWAQTRCTVPSRTMKIEKPQSQGAS